jgi:hypothetical protein
VNGIVHPHRAVIVNRVTGLIGAAKNSERSSTKLQHFWHERQTVKRAMSIQGRHDFFSTPYANSLTWHEICLPYLRFVHSATLFLPPIQLPWLDFFD